MRLSLRLILALFGGVTAVSVGFAVYQAGTEMRAEKHELQRQALILAESQQRSVEPLLQNGFYSDLQAVVDRFQNHERLAGVAIYDANGKLLAITPGLASRLTGTPPAVSQALRGDSGRAEFFRRAAEPMHVFSLPLHAGTSVIGAIAIFHDVGYIGARGLAVWQHALAFIAAQTLLIACITILIVRWNLGKPMQRMAQWLRDLHAGGVSAAGESPKEEIFQPLATEVTRLATSLNTARAAAEEEARLREAGQSLWTPERLRISVEKKLNGSRLFAVSNREPYEHTRQGSSVAWSVPPSGLVTALEPVLRACDGTWVAQATGDADRGAADEHGRLRVPPDNPQYTLRRVWLTSEEEDGFYFGFANEGLWPLCHIAHTRPVFRAEDWGCYQAVNRKFADALLDEMEGEKSPVVLVQDYHFALLPRMIKERRPDARVAIFWHIPWPNPEAFGICPWQSELLDGMLGADLIGFHIQAHCNNFLNTVDQALESRIDREHFAVNRQDHLTAVRPFPISVAFSGESAADAAAEPSYVERAKLFRQLGIEPTLMGLGVDRVDYTKGIPERFRGIERFLEQNPSYQKQLTFVQIGAPSRTHIKRYQDLMTEVEAEADRINRRFGAGGWKPIVFLMRHHSHEEITRYYRAADFCLVTSLHDGMNLVAKEYAASRHDEQGALILSRFAGASHELADALVVNPYDTDELARAIHAAVVMPPEERRLRMQRLRAQVKEHTVYLWAGSLIGELAGIRTEAGGNGSPKATPNTMHLDLPF
ncbi:MAG: alpha,alpha-trehalose-phosphate synthase, partial [Bryobacterales bacterium]|nr:alpha,alpha-trehalose-phosphate synthase [Bryobacterales bacterium]